MKRKKTRVIKVVDLFCGIGGLTYGLNKAGLKVVAGIDNDKACKYGYERNNGAKFIEADILNISGAKLNKLFGNRSRAIRVLAGCAPCQPFSRLNLKDVTKKQLQPLEKFGKLIEETKPDIVSMENVADLADTDKYPIFKSFLKILENNSYEYQYSVVDASEFGVPQKRKRLVLLASRHGAIELLQPTHSGKSRTVRHAIERLSPIKDGEADKKDRLHRASKLSDKNLARIKATQHNGGNSKDWNESLVLDCHKKNSGKTYSGTVYARMRWDEPAPTMTTQCNGLGNGRFGHPTQNRAISLREAALLQTFPKKYKFVAPRAPIYSRHVARFIGNAVPPRLGYVIGKAIREHIRAVL